MKTLKHILQETKYAYGIKLNKIEPRDLIKQLKKAGGNHDTIIGITELEAEIVHIDKFKMAKDGKVTVGDEVMDSSVPEDVIKTYRSTDDAEDTMDVWPGRPVFVGEGRPGKWYFMILENTADVKSIVDQLDPTDVHIKDYKGNSYYKMDGLATASSKKTDQDIETATTAKKKAENQLAWNKEIPQTDYKLGEKDRVHINKIRQLVGLTGKNDTFDKALKAQLEAWQLAHHLTVTGEWDNDTQDQFITLLQDKDLGRATANEYIAALVDKTDIKPKPKDTTPADGTRVGSGITPAGNILTTQAQINQFRDWFRAGDHVDSEWYDWNTTYAEDKGKKDGLFLDRTGKIDSAAMIAAWEIAGETFMRRLADGDITLKTGGEVRDTEYPDPNEEGW